MKAALMHAALVGTGGFFGALLRFGLGGLVHARFPLSTFPLGTLAVNSLGCLLIGVLGGLVESRQLLVPAARSFAMIGLLGGFTTFSTFGYETFAMLRGTEYLRATANVALHLVLGLGLVWLGYSLARA